MHQSLLLTSSWDLTLDGAGNIAVGDSDISIAQDVASACRTFLGECWYDNSLGMPYWQSIDLLKDAERYRWLRKNSSQVIFHTDDGMYCFSSDDRSTGCCYFAARRPGPPAIASRNPRCAWWLRVRNGPASAASSIIIVPARPCW